jgi:hypothetical protein
MGYAEIGMTGGKKGAAPGFYPYLLHFPAGETILIQNSQDPPTFGT